jgi:hypothetical protein
MDSAKSPIRRLALHDAREKRLHSIVVRRFEMRAGGEELEVSPAQIPVAEIGMPRQGVWPLKIHHDEIEGVHRVGTTSLLRQLDPVQQGGFVQGGLRERRKMRRRPFGFRRVRRGYGQRREQEGGEEWEGGFHIYFFHFIPPGLANTTGTGTPLAIEVVL